MSKNNAYLTGKLLIAMPSMTDPRFHRAVIYVCVHDKQGAMGLVVNNTLPGLNLSHLLQQLGIKSDIRIKPEDLPVMNGGPVDMVRGFLLHTNDFKQSDTIRIDDTFCVTGTVDALKLVAQGQGPGKMLFALGYAGWDAGQLEKEMKQNAWLVTKPDPEIVFATTHGEKWVKALGTLGIDPAMLSGEAGRA